jgi:hypothetical protein
MFSTLGMSRETSMFTPRLVLSICTTAVAGLAAAQTFFRDDFDTLSPEWQFVPPSEGNGVLTYEINQGNLVARGVLPVDGTGSPSRQIYSPAWRCDA